jgi:hypothetical protein
MTSRGRQGLNAPTMSQGLASLASSAATVSTSKAA